MTTEELNSFLSHANNAIVGVNRAGKAPQLTPVWYLWDGETFLFSTTRDRAKYLNIKKDAEIALIVDDLKTHTYVVATGTAEIVEENVGERSRPLLQKYIPADRLEQSMGGMALDPSRVLIRLRPSSLLVNGAPLQATRGEQIA